MRVLSFKSDKDIGVVYGDIKPQNVLVFKDAITRKATVKVADFGYSTLTVGESGKISCQSQGHGMLLSIISGSSMPRKPKRRMFTHFVCCVFGFCLGTAYRNCLKEIFSLTLLLHPGKWTCDLARVIGLLSEKSEFHLRSI